MAWDYSLVYVSESTPGLAGFLYQGDNLRVFINLLFNVGYLTSWDLGICLDSNPPAVARAPITLVPLRHCSGPASAVDSKRSRRNDLGFLLHAVQSDP